MSRVVSIITRQFFKGICAPAKIGLSSYTFDVFRGKEAKLRFAACLEIPRTYRIRYTDFETRFKNVTGKRIVECEGLRSRVHYSCIVFCPKSRQLTSLEYVFICLALPWYTAYQV